MKPIIARQTQSRFLTLINTPTSSKAKNPHFKLKNLSNFQTLYSHSTHQNPQLTSSNKTNLFHNLFSHLKSPRNLFEIRKIHGILLVNGFFNSNNTNPVLGSQLVNLYVVFDRFQEALLVFNQLTHKNNFAWNAILRGLVHVGQNYEAIKFYHSMLSEGVKPDNFTYPLVLKSCSGLSALEEGRRIRDSIEFDVKIKSNVFVECALIDMFAKCGSLDEARNVFEKMTCKDLVSWSAMISGSVQNGDWYEALCLFRRMRSEGVSPDSVIVATMLPACGRLGAHLQGKGLQCCAIRSGFESDLFVSNALIDMYSKCGDTHEARRVFCNMLYKDVVSWSTLIAGHSQNCEYHESLEVFVEMKSSGVRTNEVTVASVLTGIANLKLLKQGKELHNYVIRHGFDSDIFVASALIDMYAHCRSMTEAGFIFEIMSSKDITIWNSMIVGYSLNGETDSAFGILRRIEESKLSPNSITIMSVLPLCTRWGILKLGKEIHGYVTRAGLGMVVSLGNSLIDMYCKCGYLELGVKVFDQMVERDIVTYNTIIAAYGIHGHGEQAFLFFSRLKDARIRPDKVTFIALLSACSHGGLVDKGWFFYNSMMDDYGIIPDMEHYSCMVDLLGRSGHLDDAWEFVKRMPVEPEIDVLGSLLGACRVHNRVELAELLGMQIFQKNPEDPGYHVLLSNIYASTGRWKDASKVRTMIKQKGLVKKPGNSWIQVASCVRVFRAKDWTFMESNEMQEVLECLFWDMKDEGYLPDTSTSLYDDDFLGDDELATFEM